jgi:FtsP/CotA-like multicopper oxidase with cupredoxin domain
MISRWLLILSVLSVATQGCAGSDIKVIAREGTHRFSFFDSSTPVYNYNDKIPGPTIRGREGSVLVVDVLNQLNEPTSVHWHGLRIDNAMDGVPGVTQDPIQSGERFRYRLRLKEAGTYWYHPHFNAGEQLERGLKGAFVVEERHSLPWTQDLVWLIDDWRFQRDGTIYPHFNTPHDLMHDGRWGNAITVNGQTQPEIRVRPGERIRLRLIDGANARLFAPALDGLTARVIAVDGRPVSSAFALDRFILSPGNRADLDITIPADAAGKTFTLEDRLTRDSIVLGRIVVNDAPPVVTPDFDPPVLLDFIPARLFDDIAVSKSWDLNAIRGGEFGIAWTMNRRLWPDADTAGLKLGEPVKIQFVNSSSRLHPMHIHGAFFRVLSVNGKPVAEPFTRDTVLVGPRQTIIIGLIPEHKGIWLTHCHIQSHAESGMMTTIQIDKSSGD